MAEGYGENGEAVVSRITKQRKASRSKNCGVARVVSDSYEINSQVKKKTKSKDSLKLTMRNITTKRKSRLEEDGLVINKGSSQIRDQSQDPESNR
jgi:hypothetical protein